MAMKRNFGHTSLTDFGGVGINGKNSEVHAAMGLTNLKYVGGILSKRKLLCDHYKANLTGLPIAFQEIASNTNYNNSYFPVIFNDEKTLLRVVEVLNINNIYPRRYFYPSLSKLPYIDNQSSPISEDISQRIICLPLYHSLSTEEIDMICRFIKRTLRY